MHLETLSLTSKQKKRFRMNKFLAPITKFKMAILTPQFIGHFLSFWKNHYCQNLQDSMRLNFDKELADIKSFFNWYADNFDFQFQNPVRPFHKKLCVLKETPYKERVINTAQVKLFLSRLKRKYRDFAIIQIYCAGRVGEIAGIQKKNVDLENRVLKIKEVLIWPNGVPTVKSVPKNGKARNVYINDTMMEIFKRYLSNSKNTSPFLFVHNNRPFKYNLIGAAYNRAWKNSDLQQYSGTHMLRYYGAQLGRMATGSLESVKTLTGHQSDSMALKYAKQDTALLNKEAVLKCEEFFNQAA